MSTELIAVTSDTHCGSTVGLCTPNALPLDDGGSFHPSEAQRWLWRAWERFWSEVERVREEESASLTWLNNGDAVEGDHHNTPQLPTRLTLTHAAIFRECAELPLGLKPDRIFAVRGTESHVGSGAQTEEGIFRGVQAEGHPVEPEPTTGSLTWWHLRARLAGVYLDATHHGRMGQRSHTREGYLRHYARDIFNEHTADGHHPPDLAIRSHFHQYGYTGEPDRLRGSRVLATPCFQLKTAYVHKRHAESLADVGGVIVLLRDGEIEVRPVIQRPERGPVWEAAS